MSDRPEAPFLVRQFDGAMWVPLDEAARLHDAHQASMLANVALRNEVAILRAEPSRSSPDPDWIDHLPGVTAAFGVTFGELMVPVSAIREHFAAASRLGSSPDLTGLPTPQENE